MSAWLQTKSWEEAKEAIVKSKGVAIVPIGSVEQHSYHLPLGTDTYVAMTIAEEAAEKTGAVLTPPVWFGWSPHHMVLPGTVTIRPEVLSELTYDIIESLNAHGLNKIILINGHRIVNVVWMQICAQKAQSKLGCTVKIFDPAYMSKDIVKELASSGRTRRRSRNFSYDGSLSGHGSFRKSDRQSDQRYSSLFCRSDLRT